MNTQNIINVSRICTGNNTIMTAWYHDQNHENQGNQPSMGSLDSLDKSNLVTGGIGSETDKMLGTDILGTSAGTNPRVGASSQDNKKSTIKTIKTVSAGRLGLKGARRGSPYAAELVGRHLGQIIESKHQNHSIVIYMAGKMVALGSALRGLRLVLVQNQITNLVDVSPKPHNGCRARKPRRI